MCNGVNVGNCFLVVILKGELIKELMRPWESKLSRNELITMTNIRVINGLKVKCEDAAE